MHVMTAEEGPNNMSHYEDVNCKTKKGVHTLVHPQPLEVNTDLLEN